MAETPFSPITIPDEIVAIPANITPEQVPGVLKEMQAKQAHFLRQLQSAFGSSIAKIQREAQGNPKLTDMRQANSLYTQEGPVSLDIANRPNPGDALYAVDALNAAWGTPSSPAPTDPGSGPLFGGNNILLDGLHHTDTLLGAAARAYFIVGNATPKWARFAPGSALQLLRMNAGGTDPEWFTLSLAAAGGWTDDGTIVRLTTNTDQVGIGTVTPGALLGLVNVNNASDVLVKITGKASQSGDYLKILDSAGRNLMRMSSADAFYFGDSADPTITPIIYFGSATGASGTFGANKAILTWGDNSAALSDPATTADMIGCAGARFYPYKDPAGVYDMAYGQSATEAWVLVSDETIPYAIYTGRHPSAPFYRAIWQGNGDLTNYGLIHVRKSLSAGTKGIPSLRLEETGSGTDYISVRAPAAVAANRVQLLFDMTGTIPLVGDDPPAVASKAMGKVDSTALGAAVGSTNLTNSATVGMYRVFYEIADTTADAVSVATIQFQVNYTDDAGAKIQAGTAIGVAALGSDQGAFTCYLASGELSYQTNVVGVIGATAKYALRVRVMFLG